MQLSIIEKEILKFFSNITVENCQEEKILEFLELWRRNYSELDLPDILREALTLFFREKSVEEGKSRVRFYLSKIDPSLLEPPAWSIDELLEQSRLFIEDFLVKQFAVKLSQATFPSRKRDLSVEDLAQVFLSKISRLKEDSFKIWNWEEKETIDLESELIPSPFPDLVPDFRKKRLYILAGFPGEGKTFFLINLADFFLKQGKSVLHISLEVGISELLSRYLSLWTGRPVYCWSPEIFEKIYFEGINSLSIVEAASFSSVSTIDHLLSLRNFDIVLLDYIDLLSSYRSLDNMFLEFSEIARALYSIAKKRETCIISASQLNREGQISRSFGKKEICDGLFILKRLNDTELQLYVEKLRYAPDKKHKIFKYDFSKGKIYFNTQETFQKTWEIK